MVVALAFLSLQPIIRGLLQRSDWLFKGNEHHLTFFQTFSMLHSLFFVLSLLKAAATIN